MQERQEAAAADLARRAAAKAEAKAEAARRVAEASRKAAAAAAAQQVVLQRTRHRQQLREAVMWLRMQARCPTESRLEQCAPFCTCTGRAIMHQYAILLVITAST